MIGKRPTEGSKLWRFVDSRSLLRQPHLVYSPHTSSGENCLSVLPVNHDNTTLTKIAEGGSRKVLRRIYFVMVELRLPQLTDQKDSARTAFSFA